MVLSKDTLITAEGTRYVPAGSLDQVAPDYVNWKAGSSTITLDGDFTIADLQWLVDYMSSVQSGSTMDETL